VAAHLATPWLGMLCACATIDDIIACCIRSSTASAGSDIRCDIRVVIRSDIGTRSGYESCGLQVWQWGRSGSFFTAYTSPLMFF